MRDKLNIIKINGFTGIFLVVFLIGCLIEGAIMFPSRILMYLWNFIAGYVEDMPTMTLLHGAILWAIIALSGYAILKGKKPITYHSPIGISEAELKQMLADSKNFENFNNVVKDEKSEQEIKH